jgi:hypothetical protein
MAQLMIVAGVHKTERLSGYCYMNLLGTLKTLEKSSGYTVGQGFLSVYFSINLL